MTDTVILEASVPATALAMEETLTKTPEVTLEIERVVAHESGALTPYFWVRGGDLDTFESVIEEDPTVAEVTRLDIHDGGTLYRATWPPETKSVAQAYLNAGAVILEAVGQNDEWELRLRFDTYSQVSEFRDYCDAEDIPYDVTRMYNPSAPKAGGQFGVTPKQRDALVEALESGFYAIPRDESMADLAEELGISQQAFSNRLRRAHGNLVRNVLTIKEFEPEE